jgi:hypothetical protein
MVVPLLGATDKDFSIGKDRQSHVPFQTLMGIL